MNIPLLNGVIIGFLVTGLIGAIITEGRKTAVLRFFSLLGPALLALVFPFMFIFKHGFSVDAVVGISLGTLGCLIFFFVFFYRRKKKNA
jgi:hypothetical protein